MKRQRGFAYLWLLFIVALLGLGLTAISEVQSVATQRDKERELLAIGRQFRAALLSYASQSSPTSAHVNASPIPATGNKDAQSGIHAPQPLGHDIRRYPVSLDELLLDSRVPGVRRHLRKIYVDPMTGKAEWGVSIEQGRIVGVFSLSTKTPIRKSGFEVGEEDFQNAATYSDWVFRVYQVPAITNKLSLNP